MSWWMRAGLLALLAGLMLQASYTIAAPPASAAFPGANGHIAYSWSGGGAWGISSVQPNGRRDRVLWRESWRESGRCPEGCGAPAWSPDGRRLVFDVGSRLAMMRSDGSHLRLLARHSRDDSEPTFAPDGKRVAFTAKRASGENDVLVLNLATGRTRLLVRQAGQPSWSTRNQVAFVRRGNIYVVSSTGGRVRRLTYRGGDEPDWSPDGELLAFISERPVSQRFQREGLYVLRSDGRGLRHLRRAGVGTYQPAWSPDGRKIAYHEIITGILAITADGRHRRFVVAGVIGQSGSFDASEPTWQPR